MWTYLWVDLGAFIVPFLFSFHPRLRFHREWGRAWPAILGMMLLFVPWDIIATARGVWGFNAQHLTGVQLLGLPIEEWLFFICIPYACLFTYHCFKVLRFPRPSARWTAWAVRVLLIASMASAIIWHHQAYTAPTFALLAVFLIYLQVRTRNDHLGLALATYAVLLLPFLVVNGILTGTGPDEPVVWYNGAAIIGPRIASIPVEDVFYGLLMFLLTVQLYEAPPWRLLSLPRRAAATFLLALVGSVAMAQGIDLATARRNYTRAADDPQVCERMLQYFRQVNKGPLGSGYLGAYEALWAKHAKGPHTKLARFRNGTERLDAAIASSPDDVELRFLRLSIQRNCPWFLGYHGDRAEDERRLRAGSASVTDPVLRGLIQALLAGD